jgi:ATP-dependent RNA helicase HelY
MTNDLTTYRGIALDTFQQQAIAALAAGRSVLVCAPTGTGKTMVADWVVDRALERGRDVVYTAPIKALSNQKFRDYCRRHGEDKVGLVTGDLVIRRDAPCRVMTTEILRNMLLAGESLPLLDAVVIDEIHFLDDRERGTTWEELLIYLPQHVQIVGLSATLSNQRAFAEWLGSVRGAPIDVVTETRRAVPLTFHICNLDEGILEPAAFDARNRAWAKRFGDNRVDPRDGDRGRSGRDRGGFGHGGRGRRNRGPTTSHMDIFDALREGGLLPALYFAFSRKTVEQYARGLSNRLRFSLLDADEQARTRRILDDFARTDTGKVLDVELRHMLERGVAYHHAGVNVQIKALVEELYEQRLVKMLYCTSTFALGINMPARGVAFDGLKKFDGTSMRPLTTREFMQKAGRAGRRGMDTEGHVVIRMDHDDWAEARPNLQAYLRGDPEPVRSSFSLSFNSVANLLHANPLDRIREIVDKSFLNWSRQAEAQRMLREASVREKELEGATRKEQKAVAKLVRRAQESEGLCWSEFEGRVGFLKSIGYLDAEGAFAAGARILRHVQIEEIFVTELILSGLLEDIDDNLLFGLMCSVNKEFGRDVRTRPLRGPDLNLAREANKLRHGGVVTGAERITGMSTTWCPEMIPFGRHWAEGRSLSEIMLLVEAPTDISGDLVGAFRRAKDLIGQLRDVYADDAARRESLGELIRKVSRDEVLVVD